jgi:hypothetical protein
MHKCEICGCMMKKETDWFMVKNTIWKKFCAMMGISTRSLVCTECFERVHGEIRPEHLLTGEFLPAINFWIVKKHKAKEFIPLIKRNLKLFGPSKECNDLLTFLKK